MSKLVAGFAAISSRLAPFSLPMAIATVAIVLAPIPLIAVLFHTQEHALWTRLDSEAPPRHAKVLEEIARSGEHPWAGVYRTNGWMFAIAPEAGFTLSNGSRCGRYYAAFGSVLADQGALLKLQIELEGPQNSRPSGLGLDDTLHWVRWDDLQFAVPARMMATFCSEVADGYSFPHFPFRHVGELGDFKAEQLPRPKGKPGVPSEFQHLIPDAPISCRVVSLIEWQRRPELDDKGLQAYDAVYSIDAGSDDGLEIGMRMFVEGVPQGRPFEGHVEQVDRHTGHFQVRAFTDSRESAEGLVGLRAATRFERVIPH